MNSRTTTEYIDLIRSFTDERISASTFEEVYLRLFKDDPTIRPDAEYEILNRLFSDVDRFCADPAIRQPDELDEQGLHSKAREALDVLIGLTESP